MKKVFRALVSLIFLIFVCTACASFPLENTDSTSTPDTTKIRNEVKATVTRIWECRGPFVEVTNLTADASKSENWDKLNTDPGGVWSSIVSQLVRAGEAFLKNCAGSDLEQLSKWAMIVPPSFTCGRSRFYHYIPTTQRIDVNNDGTDEIILHTQVAFCAPTSRIEGVGSGGISLIFFQNQQSGDWKGQIIWPVKYFVDKGSGELEDALWYHPEPQIQMLNMRDSQGRTFMAISRFFFGSGINAANELTVLRWDKEEYEIVLQDYLLASCKQPTEWEFRQDGAIVIPFAEKANEKCEQREAKMYVLENDEIIAKEP